MAAHDTRLLTNLIKSEKEAQQSFSNYTRDSSNAIGALDAWSSSTTGGAVGGGGSGEGKELMVSSVLFLRSVFMIYDRVCGRDGRKRGIKIK